MIMKLAVADLLAVFETRSVHESRLGISSSCEWGLCPNFFEVEDKPATGPLPPTDGDQNSELYPFFGLLNVLS